MSKKPSGLGKGLEALIPKTPNSSLVKIPLSLIKPGVAQPRRRFDLQALQELADSIKEKGLLQPLLVRPKGDGYELIAGERRWRASSIAGLSEVPVVIRDLTDQEALEVALIENLQREDLNPVEEAMGYQRLLEMELTQDQIAKAVGKARTTIANALRLLALPSAALQVLEANQITAGHARALLMLPENRRMWGLQEILSKSLSVREAEKLKDKTQNHPRSKTSTAYPEIAKDLSQQLGLKVRFTAIKKGRLEIHYHSEEELNAILQQLGYQN